MRKEDYKPIDGFYDLRAFEMIDESFIHLWEIQKMLKEVDDARRRGSRHPQAVNVKVLSTLYVKILSQYPVTDQSLI